MAEPTPAGPDSGAVRCNLCGSADFADFAGRRAVQCTSCDSLERTRVLWLVLDDIVRPGHRVLHFAPEKGIHDKLIERLGPDNYTIADPQPQRYRWTDRVVAMDMTDLETLPTRGYDVIVHSHVLEHVPCTEAYTLYHLHRALKDDGRHVFIVPIKPGCYYDCTFADVGREERIRRFGQWDHVRMFGLEDLRMTLGKLVALPWDYDLRDRFDARTLHGIGLDPAYWTGLSANAVLNLGRYDMAFLKPEPPAD